MSELWKIYLFIVIYTYLKYFFKQISLIFLIKKIIIIPSVPIESATLMKIMNVNKLCDAYPKTNYVAPDVHVDTFVENFDSRVEATADWIAYIYLLYKCTFSNMSSIENGEI